MGKNREYPLVKMGAGSIYCRHFGLSEEPFRVTPDPSFLYETNSHCEALAALIHGIRERRGFICLIGEPGTGKTTLLNAALDRLSAESEEIRTALLFNPADNFSDLLHSTLVELGLADPAQRSGIFDGITKLNEFAINVLKEGGTIVLVVDEAQALSVTTLERLRLLSNLETRKHKLIQIVLAGQPGLDHALADPRLSQLKQRIGIRRHIAPLTEKAVAEYIDHRLRLAGRNGEPIFANDAVRLLSQVTQGIPRKINTLCDNTLTIAYALGKARVTVPMVKEAVEDLGWGLPKDSGKRKRVARALGVAGAGALVAATVYAFSILPAEKWLSGGGVDPAATTSFGSPLAGGDVAPSPTTPSAQLEDATGALTESMARVDTRRGTFHAQEASSETVGGGDTAPRPLAQEKRPMTARAQPNPTIGNDIETVDGKSVPMQPVIANNGSARADFVRLRLSASTISLPPGLGIRKLPEDKALGGALDDAVPANIGNDEVADGAKRSGDEVGSPRVAIVQPGESVSKIVARVYGLYADEYLAHVLANNPELKDPNRIFPGQQILVPELGEKTLSQLPSDRVNPRVQVSTLTPLSVSGE
jgi:general secretion pathway protein A